jgi:magnesium-transporting ATPase (P-type)
MGRLQLVVVKADDRYKFYFKITPITIDETLKSLGGQPEGLTQAETQRRLKEYGPNRVEEVKAEPMLLRFVKEFTHFFAIIFRRAFTVRCRCARADAIPCFLF